MMTIKGEQVVGDMLVTRQEQHNLLALCKVLNKGTSNQMCQINTTPGWLANLFQAIYL